MAFWHRRKTEDEETRALTSGLANPAGWLVDSLGSTTSNAGERVTVQKAMGLVPVWSAVSIISEQIGALPLKVYREIDGQKVEASYHRSWRLLHDRPNEYTTASRFWATAVVHYLLWGNVFIEKTYDENGIVEQLWLLDPARVLVRWDAGTRTKGFRYEPARIGEHARDIRSEDVIHILGLSVDGIMGESVIGAQRNSIGAAIARDRFEGGFYERGTVLSGILKHKGQLSQPAASRLSEQFKRLFSGGPNAHGVPVVEEDMDFQQVASPLRDLQFVEAQQLTRTDIAILFKLPPNYLGGSSGDSLTYATVESNQLHFALHAIAPVTIQFSKALSQDPGLLPQNVFTAEFVLEAMLRGDATARADFYTKMSALGALSADEIRAKENLGPAPTDLQPGPPPMAAPSASTPVNGVTVNGAAASN